MLPRECKCESDARGRVTPYGQGPAGSSPTYTVKVSVMNARNSMPYISYNNVIGAFDNIVVTLQQCHQRNPKLQTQTKRVITFFIIAP